MVTFVFRYETNCFLSFQNIAYGHSEEGVEDFMEQSLLHVEVRRRIVLYIELSILTGKGPRFP